MPHLDVVELGSSIGVVASHIAHKLAPSRRFISIEADPRLLGQIELNVTRNAPLTELAIVHGAVDYSSDGRSSVDFIVGARNVDSRVSHASNDHVHLRVPTVTFSGILDQYKVGYYALVSDIEGAEAGLLEKEWLPLQRCQQVIIELHKTEYEGREVSIRDMCSILQSKHGFRLRDQRGAVYVFER